eukprot:Pgem_evm1s5899
MKMKTSFCDQHQIFTELGFVSIKNLFFKYYNDGQYNLYSKIFSGLERYPNLTPKVLIKAWNGYEFTLYYIKPAGFQPVYTVDFNNGQQIKVNNQLKLYENSSRKCVIISQALEQQYKLCYSTSATQGFKMYTPCFEFFIRAEYNLNMEYCSRLNFVLPTFFSSEENYQVLQNLVPLDLALNSLQRPLFEPIKHMNYYDYGFSLDFSLSTAKWLRFNVGTSFLAEMSNFLTFYFLCFIPINGTLQNKIKFVTGLFDGNQSFNMYHVKKGVLQKLQQLLFSINVNTVVKKHCRGVFKLVFRPINLRELHSFNFKLFTSFMNGKF